MNRKGWIAVAGVLLLVGAIFAMMAGLAGCTGAETPAEARQRKACHALRVPGRGTFDGHPGWIHSRGFKHWVRFVPDSAATGMEPLFLWCSQVRQEPAAVE